MIKYKNAFCLAPVEFKSVDTGSQCFWGNTGQSQVVWFIPHTVSGNLRMELSYCFILLGFSNSIVCSRKFHEVKQFFEVCTR